MTGGDREDDRRGQGVTWFGVLLGDAVSAASAFDGSGGTIFAGE